MTRIMRGEWVLTNLVVSLCAAVIVAAGTGTQLAAQNITSTTSSLTPANGFSNLPLAAQAKISSVLARDAAGYQAAKRGQTVQMVNARHGLSASFTAAGVEVIAGRDRWNFVLRGYGYGDDFATGPAVAPRATANRVEYQRGTLTEWYLNGPLGLEQGFTLARTPGKRKNQPLTLAFTITGNVRAAAIRTVGVILSRTDGAAALRYHGLTAQDATGRDLRTWLEVKGQRLWLRVDDDGAEYPLVVDPIFQHAKLTASDASFDFGRSVSSSGDTVVVGAPTGNGPFFQGSAYVFVKPAGGWSASLTESAKLTASDGATNDFFGRDVAVSGDTIVIGAYGDDIGPNTEQGSAYVFVKPAGGWSGSLTESAKLTASDGAALDRFGSSVAISGDTIVVGAPVNGAAYVFVKPPAGWIGDLSESATLTASDWVAGDAFGGFGSVAVNGATIVVGAGRDDIGLNIDQGSAYVFEKPLTGWIGALTESAKLIAADGGAGDFFGGLGSGVGVSGDTVLVGANLHDHNLNANHEGSAYVFVKPAGGWSGTLNQDAELMSSVEPPCCFGHGNAMNGNLIVIGSPSESGVAYVVGAGAAHVFVKPAGGWTGTLTEVGTLAASDGAYLDQFGYWVAMSGDSVVAGAPWDDENVVNQGSAYVFSLAPVISGVSANPSVLSPPNHAMVNVTVEYTVTSTTLAACALSVTSNEPANGFGDGDSASDWSVLDANHLQLRAERSGVGSGRVYAVTITCTNALRFSATDSVMVTVPR